MHLSSPLKAAKSTPAPPGGRPTSSPPKRRRESEPELLTPARSIRNLYYKESSDDDNDYESDSDDGPPPPTPVKRKVVTCLASPSKGKRSHTPAPSRLKPRRKLNLRARRRKVVSLQSLWSTKNLRAYRRRQGLWKPTMIMMKIQIKCFC